MTRHQLTGTVALIVVIAGAAALYRWTAQRAATPEPAWQVAIERYTPPVADSIDMADSVKRAAGITDTASRQPRHTRRQAAKRRAAAPAARRDAYGDVMKQDNQ